MYAVTKSIFTDIYSIYVEPRKVFTKSSSDFGAFWAPILLIPLLIFMANYAYFERVSPEYFVEEQLAQKQDISQSEYNVAESLLLDMHGSQAYITSTVEVLTWILIGLFSAAYLFIVAKWFSGQQMTFRKSLVWTSWLLMPVCIAKIISIISIFHSSTGEISYTLLSPLTLAQISQLFTSLNIGSTLGSLISVFTVWESILLAVFLNRLGLSGLLSFAFGMAPITTLTLLAFI